MTIPPPFMGTKRFIEPAVPLVLPRKRSKPVTMPPKPTGTLVALKTRAEIRSALQTGSSLLLLHP